MVRQVFSRIFYLRRNLENVKEKPTRKTCYPLEKKRLTPPIYPSNFARRHFFNVNKVSIVFSSEVYIKTGESI